MKLKVFVAGGSGFIGSNFVMFMRELGIHVDYCSSTEVFFQDEKKESVAIKSLLDLDLSEYDSVIHCAAFTGGVDVIKTQPDKLISENTKLTLDLLSSSVRGRVRQFVFISSSAVYPASLEELKEEDGFKGDPDSVFFGPGWMKRYCEKLCAYYYQQYGMEMLVIRPSNLYGPYDHFDPTRSHVIPALIDKFSTGEGGAVSVYGTPNVLRDFIYVNDFVQSVIQLIDTPTTIGFETVNVCNGYSISMFNLVKEICRLTDPSKTFTFDVTKPITRKVQKICDAKLRRSVPTLPLTSLEDGLKKTIEYYKQLKASS